MAGAIGAGASGEAARCRALSHRGQPHKRRGWKASWPQDRHCGSPPTMLKQSHHLHMIEVSILIPPVEAGPVVARQSVTRRGRGPPRTPSA